MKKATRLMCAVALGGGIFVGVAAPAVAAANPPGYSNFPGNNGTSCDAWHGAPGGLGVNSPYYWVRSDAGFGQEQGVVTGQGNAQYSATCNQ